MGGIATTARGGHRFTHDIDIFCKAIDAERRLTCSPNTGFDTEKLTQVALQKRFKRNVMVDVIFQSSGADFPRG